MEEKTDGNREQNADGLVLPRQQESNPEATFTLFPRLPTELRSGWNSFRVIQLHVLTVEDVADSDDEADED